MKLRKSFGIPLEIQQGCADSVSCKCSSLPAHKGNAHTGNVVLKVLYIRTSFLKFKQSPLWGFQDNFLNFLRTGRVVVFWSCFLALLRGATGTDANRQSWRSSSDAACLHYNGASKNRQGKLEQANQSRQTRVLLTDRIILKYCQKYCQRQFCKV